MTGQSKSLFSYGLFVHACSGSAASCVALTFAFPFLTLVQRRQLDDLKSVKHLNVFQLIQYLLDKEGIQALYKGLIPVMQSSCISNFVYFYVFHFLKRLRGRGGQSALGDLLLGAIAGAVNVLATTPFWVVNTRIKMNNIDCTLPYKDLLGGLRYIAKHEGVEKLWSGTRASLLLVSNPAIQFSVYETLKRQLSGVIGSNPSVLVFFLLGAVSKLVATFLTYPVQIIQTKMRHGSEEMKKNLPPNAGPLDMLQYILKTKGFSGLYYGFEAKVWQTVLTAALMFMTYEKIVRFVKVLLGGASAAAVNGH